ANQSFDRYCVWSEFFAQLLRQHSRLVPPESVVVAGSPRTRAPVSEIANRGAGGEAALPVLFLAEHYDAGTQEREVAPYVRALIRAGFDVWIKPHPAIAEMPLLRPAGAAGAESRVVTEPLEELLGQARVV